MASGSAYYAFGKWQRQKCHDLCFEQSLAMVSTWSNHNLVEILSTSAQENNTKRENQLSDHDRSNVILSSVHPQLTHVDQSNNWISLESYILGDPMKFNVGYENLSTFVCSLLSRRSLSWNKKCTVSEPLCCAEWQWILFSLFVSPIRCG